MCCARRAGAWVWSAQRLRCAIHSTVVSCHCLPPSCPLPTAIPSPGQVMHAHRAQGKDSRVTWPTWTRINTVWMAAFYIPERSCSVTIDLWPNVVWTEPLKQPVPLLGSLSPSLPPVGQRSVWWHWDGGSWATCTFSSLFQPRDLSLLLFRIWGSGGSSPGGSAFPSVSVGIW